VKIKFLFDNTSEQFHACVYYNLITFVHGSATSKKRWANMWVQASCAIGWGHWKPNMTSHLWALK
jgi:hypothetical protein